jgi:hypothetical protein
MNQIYPYYIALWSTACAAAVLFYFREREVHAISNRIYWRFIFVRGKVTTFVIATTGMTVIAPYTGDPTWDYYDALVMSVLTFITAPWVVGVMFRATRRQVGLTQVNVALCMWMFTTSWFYDTYILIRDGDYSQTWLANIFAFSALYSFGGLLWNLDWIPERGTIFAFMEKDWPPEQVRPVFHRIVWVGLIFMILVALMMLPFIFDEHLDVNSWFGTWRT